jgi:cyclohexanone monooxygenase
MAAQEIAAREIEAGRDEAALDALIIGAGFSGLYLIHLLRGAGFRVLALEAGADVGGTWYWNRYPGARCDVESLQYSFSFSPELERDWRWQERYAAQPEILAYARFVAQRFDLYRDILFNRRLARAAFIPERKLWAAETEEGERFTARFLIMASGCLSLPNLPALPGLEDFAGRVFHTGRWPHQGVEFHGRRVGVIGTGSSAIQSIPVIAREAASVSVFQRTPNYSVPAHNRPLGEEDYAAWFAARDHIRAAAKATRNGIYCEFATDSALEADEAERRRRYEARWAAGGLPFMAAFRDLLLDERANETAAEFVRNKIRSLVRDPETAQALAPRGYPIGTKRLCVDTGYYETYNLPHVRLYDLRRRPLARIAKKGVMLGDGTFVPLDDLVLATGFDAMTGAIMAVDITNGRGLSLREHWRDGPRTYLGLTVAGFPNLFLVTGPGSPSVLSNMMVSIEQHAEWIRDCLVALRREGAAGIEATAEAEEGWTSHVAEVGARTLYPRANSWYMGANVEGKPRLFMPYIGGVGVYREICDAVAREAYRGFDRLVP